MENSIGEMSYKVWDDGFSPIAFAMLNEQTFAKLKELKGNVNNEAFVREVLLRSKRIAQKFGSCYILINLSLVKFSEDKLDFIKEMKKKFTMDYVSAIAIVGFEGMKFCLNLNDYQFRHPKIRTFIFFEDALKYVNEQRKIHA